ncbi:MAG: Holliday junction resolvase RuvX [Candidatus Berkelbacteria bacterium]
MYLAIDFGLKRIGLALGTMYPRGAGVLDGAKNIEIILSELAQIVKENDVEAIVIGMPIRSAGEEGTIADKIRDFAEKLAKFTHLAVYFEPEQFSSAEAKRMLVENKKSHTREGGEVDEMSAVLILEQFLNQVERVGLNTIEPDYKP